MRKTPGFTQEVQRLRGKAVKKQRTGEIRNKLRVDITPPEVKSVNKEVIADITLIP